MILFTVCYRCWYYKIDYWNHFWEELFLFFPINDSRLSLLVRSKIFLEYCWGHIKSCPVTRSRVVATHGRQSWKLLLERANNFQLFLTETKRANLHLCKRCFPWLFGEVLTLSEWKDGEEWKDLWWFPSLLGRSSVVFEVCSYSYKTMSFP